MSTNKQHEKSMRYTVNQLSTNRQLSAAVDTVVNRMSIDILLK
jgi:hypothetical protein